MNFRHITWEEITSSVKYLAQKIKQMPDFDKVDGIIGIERGGLIPAVMLSHALNIPYTDFATLDLYEENAMVPPTEDKYIVVDDIADSGDTLNSTWLSDKNILCSLYLRTHTCLPEVKDRLIYAKEIDNDDWLVFPWEIDDKVVDFSLEDWV